MPDTISPCLWFDTQAEEAAAFYTSLFKDSRITDVARYPDGSERAGEVMAVGFELLGRSFSGLNGGPQFPFTEAVSLQVPCDSQEESDELYERLVEGGEPSQCGWLKDRFGLSWQVFPKQLFALLADPDPARAGRANAEMMRQQRIDLDAIAAAADAEA